MIAELIHILQEVRAAVPQIDWQKLYEAAMLEMNPDKLAACIGAAEQAIALIRENGHFACGHSPRPAFGADSRFSVYVKSKCLQKSRRHILVILVTAYPFLQFERTFVFFW